jgi:riboflavin synthase
MFTGIIEKQARVLAATGTKARRVVVEKPLGWKLKLGASIAVDGICVTVAAQTRNSFSFDLVPETLARTTAGALARGARVNLERSLRVGQELGGHFVLGHVDTRAQVKDVRVREGSRELTLSAPPRFSRLVAEKGSVTVNGVSLTIAKKSAAAFVVALIPHTLAHTNLGTLKKGDMVNVEFDTIARYLDALLKKR